MKAIRGGMKDDGTWLVKDIKCHAVFEKNMRNPMLAMMYGFSVSSCMSSALSEPDGMGLGTGARLAIANLAKLLPGWGSVVGATTSFASTYALGKVMEKFFAEGGKLEDLVQASREPEGGGPAVDDTTRAGGTILRKEFKAAEEIARGVYANQRDVIIQSQRFTKPALDKLTAELKAGVITQAEAATHFMRHTLTRHLGANRGAKPDVQKLTLQNGDSLLLCSDGLSEMVRNDQIAGII